MGVDAPPPAAPTSTGPAGRRRWLSWLRDAAVVGAVFLALQWWVTRDVVRGELPQLDAPLITIDGTSVEGTSADWRSTMGANGFVLYVWATWCGVCKSIDGTVDAFAREAPLLTVAMQSGGATPVARHLAARGHRWPTIDDADGRLARRLGVDAVPTFIFVDGKGRVRSVTQGYTTALGLRARLWWTRWVG